MNLYYTILYFIIEDGLVVQPHMGLKILTQRSQNREPSSKSDRDRLSLLPKKGLPRLTKSLNKVINNNNKIYTYISYLNYIKKVVKKIVKLQTKFKLMRQTETD